MLDLVSLRLFVQAADLGSLSRAATQSRLAIAAVSRRIAALEADYGVSLLARTGRGVVPTPAGLVLLDHAREIFRRIAIAQSDLSDYAGGLRGSVAIEVTTSAIAQALPQDLARFTAACPDIRLDIREAYTEEIVGHVLARQVEVGVVMADPSVAGVRTWPYRRDRLAIVAPADFRPAIARTRFRDLTDEPIVLMGDDTAMTRLLSAVAAREGLVLRLRVKVDSFDGVCRMVQSGFGIGVLPEEVIRPLAAGMGLRLIALDEPWAERQMLICTHPLLATGSPASRLVEFLAQSAAHQ